MKNPNAKQHAKAQKVLEKYEKQLLSYNGVFEVALGFPIINDKMDFSALEILVYVHQKKPVKDLSEAEIIPEELEGVKIDIIESHPQEQNNLDDILDGIVNPLLGGIKIGSVKLNNSGTLGMIVQHQTNGKLLGLTNWHVIKRRKGRRGNPIVQPGYKPNSIKYRIGNLYRWNKKLDCAVFEINKHRKLNAANSIYEINGKINKTQEPFIGMKVMKTGAKTGLTHGIVSSVSSDKIKIRMVPNPAKPSIDNELSDAGDSGSIWVTDEAKPKAVALHWGGDKSQSAITEFSLANSLNVIFKTLELKFRD